MYIAPNSIIKILTNVPLSTGYADTLYFSSVSAQTSYFSAKVKPNTSLGGLGTFSFTLDDQNYVRSFNNSIKVNIPVDLLNDCNYVMFQNSSYTSKWFYAFITNRTMLSNATTELTLELDEIQTWFFDMTIQPGLVLREHSVSDELYTNLMPESFNITDYRYTSVGKVSPQPDGVGMLSSKTLSGAEPAGTTIDGVFTNAYLTRWYLSTYTYAQIAEKINNYISDNGVDSIISVFLYYAPIKTDYVVYNPSDLDGYTPKNNKLRTYPYSFARVLSNDGVSHDFKFEESANTSSIGFTVQYVSFPETALRLVADNYNGLNDEDTQMIYTGVPYPAINTPAYLNYWATSKNRFGLGVLKDTLSVLSGGIGAIAGDPTSAGKIIGGVSGLADTLANVADLMNAPPLNVSSGSGMSFITKYQDGVFNFYNCSIRYSAAKSVDDYFTRFGYATNTIKKPNISSRPAFNYVQTSNIHVTGSAPADTKRVFEEALDRGMTFWKSTATFGDYSQNNGVQT